MDARQFEALSRRFARDLNRRGVVRAAGGLATLLLTTGGRVQAAGEVAGEGIAVYSCKIPGQKCKRDKQCCSRACHKKVCACKGKGQPCAVVQEGGICCTKKCGPDGKCT